MEEKIKDFFNKDFVYAVVGASNNEEKYGYKILKILKEANFKVVPINPKENEILGLKVYHNLKDVPFKIDVVDFVVPSGVTLKVLEEVIEIGIKKVWFQPNTFDDKVLSFSRRNKLKFLKDFCLLKSTMNYLKNE